MIYIYISIIFKALFDNLRIKKSQVPNVISPRGIWCLYPSEGTSLLSQGMIKKIISYNLYTFKCFYFQMASTWWGNLSLLIDNGTAHGDNSSCFSATQSTVLKGVNFGGVPIVLLLDFIVFLVGSLCVFDGMKHESFIVSRDLIVSQIHWCDVIVCCCIPVCRCSYWLLLWSEGNCGTMGDSHLLQRLKGMWHGNTIYCK